MQEVLFSFKKRNLKLFGVNSQTLAISGFKISDFTCVSFKCPASSFKDGEKSCTVGILNQNLLRTNMSGLAVLAPFSFQLAALFPLLFHIHTVLLGAFSSLFFGQLLSIVTSFTLS